MHTVSCIPVSPRGHTRNIKISAFVAKRRDVKLKLPMPREKGEDIPLFTMSLPHKRASITEPLVKTTVELPRDLWRAVKVRAMDDGSDLRGVIIQALQQYLVKKGPRREK